ncbi:MAG TPA: FKBP-type peptidyl-prolyl cis-trans isomerase [Bacteroidales bacterium]|nr:FKBP-type peptidyl-prolyl cis-trans isomerase [Bacteroidales bacterium]
MKNSGLIALTIVTIFVLGSCNNNMKSVKLKTREDSLSYAFGIVNYNALVQDSLMLDPMVVAKAMRDGEKGEPLMQDMDARNFIMSFINEREALKAEQKAILDKELYKEHIAENEAFLAKNKEKPGVITTPSGLQYEVIKMGNGPKPTTESTVKVHYVGTLIDGTEFDSSIKRGQPAEFPIIGVIPGWTEALQLMPAGSKFKLYIPQDLAYGAAGAGDVIKPFSTLIFEVELLEIVK